MIQIEREKLEKVLDALENDTYPEAKYGINTAIAIIKDVLAQKDSEPVATVESVATVVMAMVESVATVVSESGNQEVTMSWWHEPALPVGTKLYTHPPQRTWQEPFCLHWEDRWGCNHYADPKEPHPVNAKPLYTTPPQRTERPADCERCNRLEEQAYDLVGKLRVANIKLSMQPQRTWVDLTEAERIDIIDEEITAQGIEHFALAQAIEAKLKEKNT